METTQVESDESIEARALAELVKERSDELRARIRTEEANKLLVAGQLEQQRRDEALNMRLQLASAGLRLSINKDALVLLDAEGKPRSCPAVLSAAFEKNRDKLTLIATLDGDVNRLSNTVAAAQAAYDAAVMKARREYRGASSARTTEEMQMQRSVKMASKMRTEAR
jgi:hypothetical protein